MRALLLALTVLAPSAAAQTTLYSNGFETDVAGWNPTRVIQVSSGTSGVTSATGGFHAQWDNGGSGSAFTGWGATATLSDGYNYGAGNAVPTAFLEYITSVDIYLDVDAGYANNTRFDFDSAINDSLGTHRRDFIFNGGFYNDTDGSPGSGTNRFVISASTNSQPGSAYAKDPSKLPIAVSITGWYTFEHRFYDNGGVLAVDMSIYDSSSVLVNTWTVSDPTDLIGGIGGNRYGWFDFNELPVLAFDNASLAVFPAPFSGSNVATGTAPCDVIAKDLTGDGSADIATADGGSDSVTVLTNDGSGAFPGSTTVALTAGDAPAGLAAGDLIAGDGCDIAVAATGNDAVRIIDNAPEGTFTVASSLSTLPATEPVGIDVGDLDGTGTDDIVVAMQGDLLITGTGSVKVSLNGGALTALTAPVGGYKRPQRVAICDLDGDLDNDIVVTMAGTAFAPTLTTNVLLYENIGGGAFAAPITLSVAQNPQGLCCDDLDGDGDADIAVTAESFPTILPGAVVVFLNTGLTAGSWSAGAFVSGGSFTGGTSPVDIACGDLRDDSIPGFCSLIDVVAVNFGSEDLTRHDGYDGGSTTFQAQSSLAANLVPVALAMAHFDDDKTLDIVVANKASDDVTVLLSYTPTLTKTFGVGCAGTSGVPVISAVGLPTFSNPAFGVKVSNARPFAPTLLGLSLDQFTTPLGPGCDLFLLPPIVLLSTVTNGAGEVTVSLPIPGSASSFAGCPAYFQYFIFDPAGAYAGQFAFSDALRIKVGN